MAAVSFHFHGYQPGDIVRWIEPDPLRTPRFEERHSPVAHTIRGQTVKGRNWTDAVLHTYRHMEATLERAPGAASVDIEPQTLVWLLEKDPEAYQRVLAAWDKGVAGLVMTPPFHPILPHQHRLERETLFQIMIDFYAPLLRRHGGRPVGLWLPECAYSADTVRDFLAIARRFAGAGTLDVANPPHLILDERQLRGRHGGSAWSRVPADVGLSVIARDHGLSGAFAFGTSSAQEFVRAAKTRNADSLLVASDLESLLAGPTQAERFEAIVEGMGGAGLMTHAPSPPREVRPVALVEDSSWSDYDDQLHEGHTSDTRWTGIRRSDGLVIARTHRGEPMSQLWKHAFRLATEQIETAVRRVGRDLLEAFEMERRREIVGRLAVAYARHLLRAHHRHNGATDSDLDFSKAAERILGGVVDVEVAAYFARAYTTMLMGLRSDPGFWENPDTRVTFQNVVCLAQSALDGAHVWTLLHRADPAERLLRLMRATLLEFSEAYSRGGFDALLGREGWETQEDAWLRSLQSEVSRRSGYDVVRRAALFAVGGSAAGIDGRFPAEEVVADTGHIAGEVHGAWDNPDWCEHRP